MRLNILFLFIICFLINNNYKCFSEPPTNQSNKKLSENELWEIYYDLIGKLKLYQIPSDKTAHAQFLKPSLKFYEAGRIEAWSDHFACIESEKYLRVYVDILSGEIISLYVLNARKKMDESLELNKPEKLKLTEKKAIQYAKNYLFLNRRINLPDYEIVVSNREGYWSVYFWRTLGGYRYYKDYISVTFSEKYGLMAYNNWLFSDECDTKAKISEKQAIELSGKALGNIVSSSFEDKSKKIRTKLEDSTLMIINPFLLENDLGNKKHSLDEMRKTRLAWKVLYFEDPFFMGCYAISIYIDAITGKLLFWYQVAP